MSIHLIETYEEDSYIAVAAHVAELLNEGQIKSELVETPGSHFLSECEELISQSRFDELIGKLAQHLDTIYSKCSEKDAECCVAVIVHLVGRVAVAEPDKLTQSALRLATALGSNPEVAGDAKLGALLALYSACTTPPSQYTVLTRALEFAKQRPALAAALVPHVRGKGEGWHRQWKLPSKQARELYFNLASLMKGLPDRSAHKEYLRLVSQGLSLVDTEDAAQMKEAKGFAAQAIIEFVASPDIFQCDFWELPAVAQLQGDASGGPLLQLLGAMLAGDLAAVKAAATPEVVEALQSSRAPTDLTKVLDKARLLALLVLAARAGATPVPFSDIQSALDVSADQVQNWLVRAIGGKLVEARIDAVAQRVSISRCHHRTFAVSEWARLSGALARWETALSGAVDMMAGAGADKLAVH